MACYRTYGTCSREIMFKVENDILQEVRFIGGCSGNLQAVSKLVVGRHIDEIIRDLKGIQCRKGTSCPDQLAIALMQYKENKNSNIID